jgi:hypothetical protein
LGADRSNTGALSFTSSALARPSDAPAEQSPRHRQLGSIFGRECLCAPHALGLFIFALHRRRRNRAVDGIADRHEELLLPGREQARRPVRRAAEEVGALARMFTVEPAARLTSPRKVNPISPCGIVNISSRS